MVQSQSVSIRPNDAVSSNAHPRDADDADFQTCGALTMDVLLAYLPKHGLLLAFLNVWAAQSGLPFPAYPTLIVTGALSVQGGSSPLALLAACVVACLIADTGWYVAGRRHGNRVLHLVCRISISPDSCVRQTESLFSRWGVASLTVAKLIPGFGTIATVLSGNARVPFALFLLMDAIGAAVYAGIPIGIGMLFHEAVDSALGVLAELGRFGVLLLIAAFGIFIAAKWWQRHRLIAELRMTRIDVRELEKMLGSELAPTIIDVRSRESREREGVIPGALPWSDDEEATDPLPEVDRDTEVVVYCACPNEVSAAKVAQRLKRAGFVNVRPLHGGIDAWIAAGLPVVRAGETSETEPV